ncbi:MAG: hypothetical protein Q9164_002937 [Protoblastenia rupestris]
MASQVEITIPTTSISTTPKPYTLYNISLCLPLRAFSLPKRYSDFTTLHSTLTSQAGSTPPIPLPSKSYFTSTTSSPTLTESRRQGLQAYLNGINQADDDRWRNTSAWRTFLNLPSTTTTRSLTATNLHSAITSSNGAPITDPVVWLDQHRDLKARLHDARLHLTKRDQADTAKAQHEASAQAKKCLLGAGTMVRGLEGGLKSLGSGGKRGIGEGEVRRRRDLLASAVREKEGLENLLSAMTAKSALERTVASVQQKSELVGGGGGGGSLNQQNGSARSSSKPASGRVLGKETAKTRELDNNGVLQLQQQFMKEQDEDVMVLAQAVARQKELGVQIQEELAVQGEMLGLLDEDVDRVQGKVDVARKRVNEIS